MTRARAVAYWTVPALICLAVHWRGFEAWFRSDDFAWLSLFSHIHSLPDLLGALFLPKAQGTIRPWSERAFFIVGYALFGLNALPFRIVIFATQFAGLALTQAVGVRLTGSRAAGFCAAILWTINSSTMEPLGWVCVYNEVMCAAFLLGALYMLMRYIETGDRRYKIGEWVVFLLGFGALELNVVYPALAAGYILLCTYDRPPGLSTRRRRVLQALPMFAVSIVYTAIHTLAAPPSATGDYAMHFGPSLLRTLGVYWTWSVGPVYLETPRHLRRWMLLAAIALVSLGLLLFLVRKLRAGYPAVLFCIVWYVVTFAPTLPLRDHITEYYPYIPVIGLAWLGAWGLVEAWRRGGGARNAAVALAALYVCLVLPRTVRASNWNYGLTEKARDLVAGVARARQLHPGKAILLEDVDEDEFLNAVRDKAFALIDAKQVYLAPGSEKRLTQDAEWGRVEDYILDPSVVAQALDHGNLQVYDVRGGTLRNITSRYRLMLPAVGLPLRVSVSDSLTAYLLGPGWYTLDIDHRWMGKRATLRMGAPTEPERKLYLTGYSAEALGLAEVTVSVNDIALPSASVHPGPFVASFALPDSVVGTGEIQVAIQVNKTFRPPGDPRDLGLSFGVFEIR
ncbi:MAG: hypothetical protein WBY44_37165 [Bryobacteraceae bacterium]